MPPSACCMHMFLLTIRSLVSPYTRHGPCASCVYLKGRVLVAAYDVEMLLFCSGCCILDTVRLLQVLGKYQVQRRMRRWGWWSIVRLQHDRLGLLGPGSLAGSNMACSRVASVASIWTPEASPSMPTQALGTLSSQLSCSVVDEATRCDLDSRCRIALQRSGVSA